MDDAQSRLISATQHLLWERGYVGTSPKAIQQLSGVGQGSMYHHFHSKEDLCAAAVQRSAADLRAEIEPILSGPGSAVERITAYLRRERDVLRGVPHRRLNPGSGDRVAAGAARADR